MAEELIEGALAEGRCAAFHRDYHQHTNDPRQQEAVNDKWAEQVGTPLEWSCCCCGSAPGLDPVAKPAPASTMKSWASWLATGPLAARTTRPRSLPATRHRESSRFMCVALCTLLAGCQELIATSLRAARPLRSTARCWTLAVAPGLSPVM